MKKIITCIAISMIALMQVQAQTKGKKTSKKAKTTQSTPERKSVVENIYRVDNASTVVKWTGKKVAGSHYGKIKVENGTLKTGNGDIITGNIVIDMNSMTCDDIQDEGKNGYLVGHLKNEDFFNTTTFPHAMLEIQKVTKLKNGSFQIDAGLTIKGKSNPISFVAQVSHNGDMLTATTSFKFDRTKYDVKYGSGILGTAQDKMIYDDVELEISLVANKFK